ncbi:tyrosine-type recombinase/integrase [Pseudomonas asiatica]|uniref:tyrosine-type recombinase/integrase n=1 Tax=Pseudomonas asiatica TaxID=2219225 RepID=UPI0023689E25|nr:tyrosine-type recombinase/integrase [Pseudomonas asiatica]WDM88051.1 tyrosine-type recombinase/integrase [Pseudomonas asiatica]
MNNVDAVKTEKAIEEVRSRLVRNARGSELYADVWKFGINTALRISDMLSITMQEAQTGQLKLVEGKTGKRRVVKLNEAAMAVVKARSLPGMTYLFEVNCNRAKGKPVSRAAVAKAFKDVGEQMGIALGTHSMRKTRGGMMHKNGMSIELICKVLNHSSPAVTMSYIGLTAQDVADTYDQFVL